MALALALATAVAMAVGVAALQSNNDRSIETQAVALVDRLAAGDFVVAHAAFGAKLGGSLTAQDLERHWKALVARGGPYKGRSRVESAVSGAFRIVYVGCSFDRAPLDVKVVFAENKSIEGLFFVPFKADRE
jgi:hypothetical protein